jgi:ABC-2 type transport system ATP-binding protein
MAERPHLEVEGLSRSFGEVRAVSDLSFAVARGEILGLIGPNGAGKTSTLRCLCGVLPPGAGRVRVAGHDLAASPEAAKGRLAYLPDEPRLYEYLTVWDHLTLTARLHGLTAWEARAEALLTAHELEEKRDALPAELSRGMRQKVQLACGLLHDPALILLDEPLTGLDPAAIRQTKEALRARAAAGAAIVLSSHLLGLVEELCHRVLVIARGRCVALGTVEALRAQAGSAGDGATLEELFLRLTAPRPGEGR